MLEDDDQPEDQDQQDQPYQIAAAQPAATPQQQMAAAQPQQPADDSIYVTDPDLLKQLGVPTHAEDGAEYVTDPGLLAALGTPEQPGPDESPLMTFGRRLAHGIGPALAGAATGLGTGAAIGTALEPGLGTIGGGIVGGIGGLIAGGIGAYATGTAQEAGLKALGVDDSAAMAAGAAENPWAARVGDIAPAVVPFGVGRGAVSLGARALYGGIAGATETGTELARGENLDPASIGLNVLAGGALARPRSLLAPFEAQGAKVGASFAGRQGAAPPPQGAAPPPQKLLPPPSIKEGPPLQDMSPADLWARSRYVQENLAVNPDDPSMQRASELLGQEFSRRSAEQAGPQAETAQLRVRPVTDDQGRQAWNVLSGDDVVSQHSTADQAVRAATAMTRSAAAAAPAQTSRPGMPDTGGVAKTAVPPVANENLVGDPQNKPVRSATEYPTTTGAQVEPAAAGAGVNIGEVDPAVAGVLVQKTAGEPATPRPPPLPQEPAAVTPRTGSWRRAFGTRRPLEPPAAAEAARPPEPPAAPEPPVQPAPPAVGPLAPEGAQPAATPREAITQRAPGQTVGDALRQPTAKPPQEPPVTKVRAASPRIPAAAAGIEQLRPAYEAIKQDQGGIGTAYISDLAKRSGLPLEQVHDIIANAARNGEVSINRSSVPEGRLTPDQRAGALRIPGEEPFHTVTFKAPASAGLAREAARPSAPAFEKPPLYPHASLSMPKLEAAYVKATATLSKIGDEMIAAGRGYERPNETRAKTDNLSQRFNDAADLVRSLGEERNRRQKWGGTLRPIPKAHRDSWGLTRDVIRQAPTGRAMETRPLPVGRVEPQILEQGYALSTGPRPPPGRVQPPLRQAMARQPAPGRVLTHDGSVFFGQTPHEAAARARMGGYQPHQIFNADGTPYVAPRPPPAAQAAAPPPADAPQTAQAASARAAAAQAAPAKGAPSPFASLPPITAPGFLDRFKAAVDRLVDSYKKTFDPARISELALKGEAPARGSRAYFVGEQTRITRAGIEAEKMWDKVPEQERLTAMNDYQHGRPVDPRFKDWFENRLRPEMEKASREEKVMGSQAGYRDNYIAQEWERPKAGQASVTDFFKSMGPRWFQKARTFGYIEDGYNAGYRLRNTNPEVILRSRLIAGADMRSKMELLHDWRDNLNLAAQSPLTDGARSLGWQELTAPDGRKWLIAPDVQAIWKNGIEAKGLWQLDNLTGDTFRAWMAFKAAWVPIKLTASLFHPLHVLHINFAGGMARATDQMLAGDMQGAVKSMGQAISPYQGRGVQGRAQWALGEHVRTPEGKLDVQHMEEGGFVPMMNEEMKSNARRQFRQALASRNLLGAGWHGAQALVQAVQAPLFEHWIPHLKTAAYLNDVDALLARRPDLMTDNINRKVALSAIAKSIDNRFGEMFYGGLFWNRYVKDVSIGSFLSLGWNLGFAREFIGAGIEAGTRPAGALIPALAPHAARQVVRDSTNKIKFATIYLATAAAIGGIMTKLLSGEDPKETNDYIFPRAGGINPDGSPRRLTTMFYLREGPMLEKHIQEQGGGISGTAMGAWNMLWNKMLFQPLWELWTNRDYFGREVSDTNAPDYKRLMQMVEHTFGQQFSPMAVTGAQRAGETGGGLRDKALAYAGFGPAPSYAGKSALDNRIAHLYETHVAPGARAYQDEDTTQAQQTARAQLLTARQSGDRNRVSAAFAAAVKSGIAPSTLATVGVVSSSQKMFEHLPQTDQIAILGQASPQERGAYWRYTLPKTKLQWNKEHP